MRRIKPCCLALFFLLAFLAPTFAQQKTTRYDRSWRKVDSLLKKGLPKSALAEVNRVYTLAKKEKQEAQQIKALLYRMDLEERVTDDNTNEKNILRFENDISASSGATRAILYSLAAYRYNLYALDYGKTYYNRSNTRNFEKKDIATWSGEDFDKKITSLYLASLKDKALLQKTRLESYAPLIIPGNARYLRPTLYDLLAHTALEYFSRNDLLYDTKPADAFEMKDDNLFAPARQFARLPLATNDTASKRRHALVIYQNLLAFHLNDDKPDALIDVDMQRLNFINTYAVMPDKGPLYENALKELIKRYPGHPATAQASYLIANRHVDNNRLYYYSYDAMNDDKADNEIDTGGLKLAAAICEEVLKQPGESEGKTNCYNLLQNIQRKFLHLSTEKVNVPGQPFRTLVSYRNFSRLYLRLIPLSRTQREKIGNRYDSSYWTTLARLRPLRSWTQDLPDPGDYRQHSVEIKTAAMPAGEYLLLASVHPEFDRQENLMSAQLLYISHISYINNGGSDYFVLDRETGQPLTNATIQPWFQHYDARTRKYKDVKGQPVTTDEHGFARLPNRKTSYEQMKLSFYHNGDSLFIDEFQYSPLAAEVNMASMPVFDSMTYEKNNGEIYFFTDRSIYRPGQTVYFKGIALTKDRRTGKRIPWAGKQSKIILSDVNDRAVDSLLLTTNAYGSFSGRFTLPAGLLNGNFSIQDQASGNTISFSVEEYKRPTFYAQLDTLKGSYRVNDSITVTGFAKAYAGNTIDGAKVHYRVQRVARFIYPWLLRKRGPMSRNSNMQIADSTITTAADGSFHLRFKAIPDLSIDRQLDPVFDYTITADITDGSGETRSASQTVQVSYKALQLSLLLSDRASLPVDSFRSVQVDTRNMAGDFVPARATIVISRLQTPGRLIRERYWAQPDQFVLSKADYIASFPADEYKDESQVDSWPRENIAWQASDSTAPGKSYKISTRLPQGWYVVEAMARDINGDSVKDMKYVQLFDEKSDTLPSPSYTWNGRETITVEPGETARVQIGSSATGLYVIQQIDKKKGDTVTAPEYHFFALSNEKKNIDFVPGEPDRGGFGVYHLFVKNNRFYSFSNGIQVPWSNKELTISYSSFRDKTLPGSEEKWQLHISGPKKEKLAAEMLAGLYDASLDEFRPLTWDIPDIYDHYSLHQDWSGNRNFESAVSTDESWAPVKWKTARDKTYDILMTGIKVIRNPDGSYRDYYYTSGNPRDRFGRPVVLQVADWAKDPDGSKGYTKDSLVANAGIMPFSRAVPGAMEKQGEMFLKATKAPAESPGLADGRVVRTDKENAAAADGTAPATAPPPPQIRKNFHETAFFFPDLTTDSAGNISFGFTMPEALTKWKFQALAHTKDLAFGYTTANVVTQKPLMVQPNAPRFLREGDKIDLSARVVNMTGKELTGTVQLELFNAATNQSVDGWFRNMYPVQYFTAEAGQSTVVRFSIDVPYQYGSALVYRFVATAGDNSDGEEASLPVLTNSLLVTESMPLPIRGSASRNFKFDKLLQSGQSETLQQHALTVEFTTNPAWYAVQALPYLTEYPYECAEQTFNRYYANALASMIARSAPKLKQVIDTWNTTDTAALLSNLQKNEELKAVLLEETPWVLAAKTEAQQKKNIALLFDMVRMSGALSTSFEKLKQLQTDNGGFVWFKGGKDDRYITQYILSGIGHLKKLHALTDAQQARWSELIKPAIDYADKRIKDDYDYLIQHKIKLDQDNLSYTQLQYLYLRSLFNEYDIPGASFTAINYYRKQSQQYWLQQSRYMQGMIALSLFRTGDVQTARDILRSLKENAIDNEEMGMYWKENAGGYYWYQASVETQSLLIEAFSEIGKDNQVVDDLKTWLLKQKQVQGWRTTKATAEACYALLLQGNDWLSNAPDVDIRLGDKSVSSHTGQAEAGTGYFKKTFDGPFVNPSMGDISVRVSAQPGAPRSSSWGAVYWQYFEQLDKITPAATPLKLSKKLFVEKSSDRGPVLEPVAENAYLKPGDKIKVRIELRSDRDMEYVHMKDMRASCMEPVNVLSGYKWQDGLGYYETTKDASTNFFFDRLPKGTYVFEYTLFVTHTGNFSNGITTIQCMYAPEFSAHSEGVRVNVEN